MASVAPWRNQIDRIAQDNHSGATDLSLNGARALIAYTDQMQPHSANEIMADLAQIAMRILTRHPSLAGLLRLFNDVHLSLSDVETPRLALDTIRRVCNEYIAWVEQASALLVERTFESLPESGTIVTLSYSSAVARSLLLAKGSRYAHKLICLESRPLNEGRELASFLSRSGIEVELAPDVAAHQLLAGSSLFMVGADSFTSIGVVNKIGTALVATSAKEHEVATVAIGDSSKIWPKTLRFPAFASENPDEVWPRPPNSVKIHNVYFEFSPWNLISKTVTERGITDYATIDDVSTQLQVHPTITKLIDAIPPT